jgi:hypothetical protein
VHGLARVRDAAIAKLCVGIASKTIRLSSGFVVSAPAVQA